MTRTITPEELFKKLGELGDIQNSPEILQSFAQASAEAAGVAKKYCTPGQTPYYKAPYSSDTDPHRLLVHMRDQIDSVVIVDGNFLHGIVYVKGSAPGEPWHYALPVHTGTYDYFTNPEGGEISSTGKVPGMKGMPPRPVIPDAIRHSQKEILDTLNKGIEAHCRRVCES